MNARERAIEAVADAVSGAGYRGLPEDAVAGIEVAGLRIVDGVELVALLAARDTLATLDDTVRTPGSRVWRTPDDELAVWSPDGPALDDFLPDGSVELVPADQLDAKSRGPAYRRGFADGRLEQRAIDGAVPAAAGEQAPGPSGGGLVGPPAPEGDHVTRAQPFTDAELADQAFRWFG